MTNFLAGDVSGAQVLTATDHIYAQLWNELRQSRAASAVVGTTSECEYYCDGTDDDVQINAAMQAARHVYVKEGSYSLGDNLRIPSNTILEGAGFSTIFTYADDTINSGVTTNNALPGVLKRFCVIIPDGVPDWSGSGATATSNVILRNFKLDCNRAGQTSLVDGNLYGIFGSWVTNWRFENLWVINSNASGIAVWPVNLASYGGTSIPSKTVITGCLVEDCTDPDLAITDLYAGIFISDGTGLPNYVSISDSFVGGNLHGICVEDSSGGVTISNVHAYENKGNGISLHTASGVNISNSFCYKNENAGIGHSASGRFISISNCDCRYNKYGIDAENQWIITGGIVRWNDDAGIWIKGGSDCVLSGIGIYGNGAGTSPDYPYGVYITSGGIPGQNLITGCQIGHAYSSYRTQDSQTYGIYEADSVGVDYNYYLNNSFANYGGSQTPIRVDANNTSTIRNNMGWVTENSGTGSIVSGTTSDIITHGLSVTPTVDDIVITLAENPTNTPGAIWVDTIGATYFTVNCENNPGASNLDFGWKAIVL